MSVEIITTRETNILIREVTDQSLLFMNGLEDYSPEHPEGGYTKIFKGDYPGKDNTFKFKDVTLHKKGNFLELAINGTTEYKGNRRGTGHVYRFKLDI